MAFFRFNRDKRGYEHFYLVQSTTNRRGKVRSRVLYWFRTPPGVRVGREPFDESVRRALETQHPEITFDWPAILDAPIPSADADKWRERRRTERVARHSIESADIEIEDEPRQAVDAIVFAHQSSPEPPEDHAAAAPAIAAALSPPPPIIGDPTRKRRRRRRGRRPGASTQPDQPSQPNAVPESAGGDEPGEPNGD